MTLHLLTMFPCLPCTSRNIVGMKFDIIAEMDLRGGGGGGAGGAPPALARWGAGGCYFHDKAERYERHNENML